MTPSRLRTYNQGSAPSTSATPVSSVSLNHSDTIHSIVHSTVQTRTSSTFATPVSSVSLNHTDTVHSTVQTLEGSVDNQNDSMDQPPSKATQSRFIISRLPLDLQQKWKVLIAQLTLHTFKGDALNGAQQEAAVTDMWKHYIGIFNGCTEPSKAEIRAVLHIFAEAKLGTSTGMELRF